MSRGRLEFVREGAVARITFDRPEAHNALTFEMYDALAQACAEIEADPEIRVAVLRGAGDKAFIAGTDINAFTEFTSGEDGIAYEERTEACIGALETLRVPTLAVIDGYAVGGGLAIAAACDLRIATPRSRFGAPLARTIGNCLSAHGYARVLDAVGSALANRILIGAELIDAPQVHNAGFLMDMVEPEELDARATQIAARLAGLAPLTIAASKAAMRRIRYRDLPDIDDIVRRVYGSEDFRNGVANFLNKAKPQWGGR